MNNSLLSWESRAEKKIDCPWERRREIVIIGSSQSIWNENRENYFVLSVSGCSDRRVLFLHSGGMCSRVLMKHSATKPLFWADYFFMSFLLRSSECLLLNQWSSRRGNCYYLLRRRFMMQQKLLIFRFLMLPSARMGLTEINDVINDERWRVNLFSNPHLIQSPPFSLLCFQMGWARVWRHVYKNSVAHNKRKNILPKIIFTSPLNSISLQNGSLIHHLIETNCLLSNP